MTTYKNLLNAARLHFGNSPFTRFLLTAHIGIYALGGLFFLLGAYLLNLNAFASGFAIYDAFSAIGIMLAVTGFIFSVIADDAMGLVIVSSIISVGSLTAWIVLLARGVFKFAFMFGTLFYFLVFGTVVLVTVVKSEKFKQMRAAAAARAQLAVIPCPKCSNFIPITSAFCPSCGTPRPVMQYAPPAPYPPAPAYEAPAPQAAPVPPAAPAAPRCASCGADMIPGAVFCAKCGTKQ